MAVIYLVVPLGHNADAVRAAVAAAVEPEAFYELQGRAGWFVSFSGTSVELSKALGASPKEPGEKIALGSVLITSVGSYYGRGPTTMWEWLKTRFESQQ